MFVSQYWWNCWPPLIKLFFHNCKCNMHDHLNFKIKFSIPGQWIYFAFKLLKNLSLFIYFFIHISDFHLPNTLLVIYLTSWNKIHSKYITKYISLLNMQYIIILFTYFRFYNIFQFSPAKHSYLWPINILK